MLVGITLPQYELDPGRDAVAAFAESSQAAGFQHLSVYDHILGLDVSTRPEWKGPYNAEHQFHEPLVLLGFVAALTQLELVTSVLILPQRAAALVAKQAAEVDVLSGGRLRLGVGIGWNRRELVALGEQWEGRGNRFEEQIELMRQLWAHDVVHFDGRFHQVDGFGIRPRPVQRPIPVWLGGGIGASDITFRRIGRVADGWMPNLLLGRDDDTIARALGVIAQAAVDTGRGEGAVELEGQVQVDADLDIGRIDQIGMWAALGASRITLRTLDEGFSSEGHVEVVTELGRQLGLVGGRLELDVAGRNGSGTR